MHTHTHKAKLTLGAGSVCFIWLFKVAEAEEVNGNRNGTFGKFAKSGSERCLQAAEF
ncbi:hypothetical protein ES332_D01G108100v1 [Gossypium tomentosum]|uniref:Uncharacterized protein n=1 Tax=Gossypium tomentosum TaxID=34277 RepID=A0A5D2M7G6_GOSTO|nr:hypothetical protein ES332_D01G108100v1 [Gossypium tomentosum]